RLRDRRILVGISDSLGTLYFATGDRRPATGHGPASVAPSCCAAERRTGTPRPAPTSTWATARTGPATGSTHNGRGGARGPSSTSSATTQRPSYAVSCKPGPPA